MKPILRSQTIAVNLPAGLSITGKVFLPDIPELRSALVDGLETYADTEAAANLDGTPVVTAAELPSLALSLVQESDRRAQDLPLQSLRAVAYGGIWKEFTGWRLNWQKCYLQWVGAAPIAAQKCVLLTVFYHYQGQGR
ncbi:MAG: hypothetical protein N2483_02685 [Burkholderiaceae bacterium]|nr:hypothetical protein [Burkholderiaceae bacterium]